MFIPDFIDIQRNSFKFLLKKGIIKEILNRNIISTSKKDLELFFYPKFYKLNPPNYSCKESILKAKSYTCKLYIPAQLVNNKTKEVKTQWILLGNLPLMTKRGHFIINGSPRIIISQMIRSPGIYYQKVLDKNKNVTYYADIISYRGTWLRLETDKKDSIWAKMKKMPKVSIVILLQAMGLTKQIIFQSIQNSHYLNNSFLEENHPISTEQALLMLYSETHPRKDKFLITKTMGKKFIYRKFMNPKTYDLSTIGRLKINKKLGLSVPETKTILTAQDLLYATDYLIRLEKGSGEIDDIDNLKNRRVRASGEIIQNQLSLGLIRLEKIIREKLKKNKTKLNLKSLITTKAINGALKEFFGSSQLSQFMDQTNPLAEITHKRRLTSVGPGGVSRETAGMAIRGIHPTHYGRICPIETPEGPNAGLVNSITIFGKINNLGFIETPFLKVYKGQVQKYLKPVILTANQEENIFVAPSDLYYSKLGFLKKKNLPTRFGKNFKQISHTKVNFIAVSQIQMISIATSLIPFLEHDDANRALMGSNMQRQAVPLMIAERPIVGTGLEGRVISDSGHCLQSNINGFITYITSEKIIIYSNSFNNKKNYFLKKQNLTLFFLKRSTYLTDNRFGFLLSKKKSQNIFSFFADKKSDYCFIRVFSFKEKTKISKKTNFFLKYKNQKLKLKVFLKNYTNFLPKINTNEIWLDTYQRSNQETCLRHKPAIKERQWIQKGDLVADGTTSVKGELALGKNILIAYMPWKGYNFEDAILINERLVYNDIYTSIHIERFELEIRDTKYGLEQITNKIPEIDNFNLLHLDENGIAKIGSWVKEGTIIVGKITPIHKKILSPHEKLLYDIVEKETPMARDTSLRVPKGVKGRVIHVQILETQNLPPETTFNGPGRVHLFIAEKRKIKVGDKIAGRHGNKGIVSKVLPRQDMPYLPDGTPIDIVLNPLGVPSRMNVGQVFECLLGLAGIKLKEQYKIIPFDETYGPETSRSLVYSKLYFASLKTKQKWLFNPNYPGKIKLFDGCTGNSFHQYVTVGQAYILKLIHLVDEKIHARSTGPYSLVTQQPLRGRSKHGGQRLGEMEVWALEGFGAAYTLQELLTIKSDDMKGRYQIIDSILKNKQIFLGTPESFKVLVRELQSLCLNVRVYGLYNNGKTKQIEILKLS